MIRMPPDPSPAAIEIRDLTMRYTSRGRTVQVLHGIDLTVAQGTVCGFLGPNGAGKTTTIHILLGFLTATSGEARILGQDAGPAVARQRIGYLPEYPQSYRFLTGRELMRMAGKLFGIRGAALKMRINQLIERVGLADAADRRIATYSRGMLQRIGLAQALINDPDLLILDEPTAGMDPLGRMEVRRLITNLRDEGKTVFFSSHELSEVELVCDQIAILKQGSVAAEGSATELAKSHSSLEQYFLSVVAGES